MVTTTVVSTGGGGAVLVTTVCLVVVERIGRVLLSVMSCFVVVFTTAVVVGFCSTVVDTSCGAVVLWREGI